jgi:ABC-type branched-subunit amino acid transport system permease subunit
VGVFGRTILLGLIQGSVFALAATGLVLTYRISGVLNFGYGAVAMFSGYLYWQFAVDWGWPVWLAAGLVILVFAPLLGVFLDTQLFSRLRDQPMVISIIATVGLWVLLQGTVLAVWKNSKSVPSLFPSSSVALPGGIRIGGNDLAIFGVAAAAAALLGVMLRYTPQGRSFRAVVDSREVAGLLGVNTKLVSVSAWALGTAFAALTGILLSPSLLLDPLFLPIFVVANVFGAAIVGYLRSLPLAYAGGLGLGVLVALLTEYAPSSGPLANARNAAPFLVVLVAVLAAPRALRLAGLGSSFIVRTRELASAGSATARASVAVAVFGVLAIVPVISTDTPSWLLAVTGGLVMSIVFLSIVVLTGYSGQISLGHTAFMGIAAFTAAHLAADLGVPMWIAMVLGVAATVPAGAIIGIAAVRVHGLYLALMTLGFAFVAHEMFFRDPAVSGGFQGFALPRPALVSGDRAFYYLALAVLGVFAMIAVNLRSGRTGRVLGAIRDSETAARSLGINVVGYKVVIFSLSAAMAGAGAILRGMQTEHIGQIDYLPFQSIFYVTIAVVGGIFHVGGAIAAGMFFGLFQKLSSLGPPSLEGWLLRLQLVLFGLGATLALAKNPEGLFGELRRGGRAILGLARRRGGTSRVPAPVTGGQE